MINDYTVYIDAREAATAPMISRELSNRFNVKIQQLDSGDYYFPYGIGIERKEGSNLYGSIMHRSQLFEQLDKLVNNHKVPVLLIEGNYAHPLMNHATTVYGTIVSLVAAWKKLKLLFTSDYKETLIYLKRFATYGGPSGNKPPPSVVQKARTPAEIRLYMLQCIRGVGQKTSKRILDKYGDFDQLKLVPPQQLCKIPGVTRKIANLINEVFYGYDIIKPLKEGLDEKSNTRGAK